MRDFYGCYLLTSRAARAKTYIGFTVNPRRRIRQHNGELVNGAHKTKKGRPWSMVLVVYGFVTQVHALQFEWAWQHPQRSIKTSHLYAAWKKRKLTGPHAQVSLMADMLNVEPWSQFPLTLQILSSEFAPLLQGCAQLPAHISVVHASMEDLPVTVNDDEDFDSDSNTVTKDAPRKTGAPACSQAEGEFIASLWATGDASGDASDAMPGASLAVCITSSSGSSLADGDSDDEDEESFLGSDVEGVSEPSSQQAAPGGPVVSPGKCADCGVKLTKNWFTCSCTRAAHVECWSAHLRSDSSGNALPRPPTMPGTGPCPDCGHAVDWMTVLANSHSVPSARMQRKRKKKGAAPKVRRARGAAAATAASDTLAAPPKPKAARKPSARRAAAAPIAAPALDLLPGTAAAAAEARRVGGSTAAAGSAARSVGEAAAATRVPVRRAAARSRVKKAAVPTQPAGQAPSTGQIPSTGQAPSTDEGGTNAQVGSVQGAQERGTRVWGCVQPAGEIGGNCGGAAREESSLRWGGVQGGGCGAGRRNVRAAGSRRALQSLAVLDSPCSPGVAMQIDSPHVALHCCGTAHGLGDTHGLGGTLSNAAQTLRSGVHGAEPCAGASAGYALAYVNLRSSSSSCGGSECGIVQAAYGASEEGHSTPRCDGRTAARMPCSDGIDGMQLWDGTFEPASASACEGLRFVWPADCAHDAAQGAAATAAVGSVANGERMHVLQPPVLIDLLTPESSHGVGCPLCRSPLQDMEPAWRAPPVWQPSAAMLRSTPLGSAAGECTWSELEERTPTQAQRRGDAATCAGAWRFGAVGGIDAGLGDCARGEGSATQFDDAEMACSPLAGTAHGACDCSVHADAAVSHGGLGSCADAAGPSFGSWAAAGVGALESTCGPGRAAVPADALLLSGQPMPSRVLGSDVRLQSLQVRAHAETPAAASTVEASLCVDLTMS